MHKGMCQIGCAMQRRVHMTYVPLCKEIKGMFLDTDDSTVCVHVYACACVCTHVLHVLTNLSHPAVTLMIGTRELSLQIVEFLFTISMIDRP